MASAAAILGGLRSAMAESSLDGYLVPGSDEHLNEYLPPGRKRREFVSGFTGSAGDLLILAGSAILYTDGRYHLQAGHELLGSGIDLMPVGRPEAKPLSAHLADLAKADVPFRLGVDPMTIPLALAESFAAILERSGGSLVYVAKNLVDPLWPGRPGMSQSVLEALPLDSTGASLEDKHGMLAEDLAMAGAKSFVTVKLDQIAWLLNLRGRDDVPYNPVFESYLAADATHLHLFLRGGTARLPAGFAQDHPRLRVYEYEAFPGFLAEIEGPVLLDPDGVTAGVAGTIELAGCAIRRALSPLEARKAVKTQAELAAMEQANLLASAAKTRAILWLRRELARGAAITESDFRKRIESLYAELPGFRGLSFHTIAATGAHGAIIHYGSCDGTPIAPGDLFLIDSGIHLGGGTTDDTRTVATGPATEEQRRAYTAVLRGHINAVRSRIPEGAAGSCLDALARAPLWEEGLHYDHGTGHGVGAYLNVHEGPFAISERERRINSVHPLRAGMVSSIEPGYYKPGWGGIRIENLYAYAPETVEGSGREWLSLRPLTWIPMDPGLVDQGALLPKEREWLLWYHRECLRRLRPLLAPDEMQDLQDWLGSP